MTRHARKLRAGTAHAAADGVHMAARGGAGIEAVLNGPRPRCSESRLREHRPAAEHQRHRRVAAHDATCGLPDGVNWGRGGQGLRSRILGCQGADRLTSAERRYPEGRSDSRWTFGM